MFKELVHDFWRNVSATVRNRSAFKEGDYLAASPALQPEYILRMIDRHPEYGSKPLSAHPRMFLRIWSDVQVETKKLCLPALEAALTGDVDSQRYYQAHRLLLLSTAPDWQQKIITELTAQRINRSTVSKYLPQGEQLSQKTALPPKGIAQSIMLDYLGSINTAKIVLDQLDQNAKLNTPSPDSSIYVRLGNQLHPAEPTIVGGMCRDLARDAMEILFRGAVLEDTLQLLGIELPSDSDRIHLFRQLDSSLPWNLLDERSPLQRVRAFENAARKLNPNSSPWELGFSLQRILATKSPEYLLERSQRKIEHTITTPPTVAQPKSDPQGEHVVPELERLTDGFIQSLKADKLSHTDRRRFARNFAKLVLNYGEEYGASYIEVLHALEEGKKEHKHIADIYAEVEKHCRTVYRSIHGLNRESDSNPDLEEALQIASPQSNIRPQRTYVYHQLCVNDLEALSPVDQDFVRKKLSEVESGLILPSKTVQADKQKTSLSLTEFKIRRDNGRSIRIYTRRIGKDEWLVVGLSLKEDNNLSEANLVEAMAERASGYLAAAK